MQGWSRTVRQYVKLALLAAFGARAQEQVPWAEFGNDGYGSWRIDPRPINSQSIAYTFGVGDDISFDRAVAAKLGARVFAFDPTPESVQWMAQQRDLPDTLAFLPFGVAGVTEQREFLKLDSTALMCFTSDPAMRGATPSGRVVCSVKSLRDIMNELGHDHLDICKLDVEGCEYEVIDSIVSDKIPIRQLLVEFHFPWSPGGLLKMRRYLKRLESIGYRIFAVTHNREISFCRVTG